MVHASWARVARDASRWLHHRPSFLVACPGERIHPVEDGQGAPAHKSAKSTMANDHLQSPASAPTPVEGGLWRRIVPSQSGCCNPTLLPYAIDATAQCLNASGVYFTPVQFQP